MANGVCLGLLLLGLIHAASGSGLRPSAGQARLFPQAPPQPQNQLRQSVQRVGAHGQGQSGGGYVHTWSQTAQNGRPAHAVEQSRPQPWSNWQVAKVPSTRPSQKAAGSSSQASHQAEAPTRRQRPSSPLKTATLFIDGVYVQMQTSARGRGRKVMAGSSSMPARFTSPQGRWLQGRYRPVPEDSQPPPGHRSGKTKSRFFNNAALAPGTRGTGRNQNQPGKRPSGSPDVHYAPTQVHEIPEHLGGFAIRRLKPQRLALAQKRASPRMHQHARPAGSLRKDAGRWM